MITMMNVTKGFQIAKSAMNTAAANSDDAWKKGLSGLESVLVEHDLTVEDITSIRVILESGGDPEYEAIVKESLDS